MEKRRGSICCVCPLPAGYGVSLVPAPACDPSVTKCPLDLFQSSLKRRGSRETYKEKKTFNQVSRGILLMLQFLEGNHLALNFLKSISIAFKIVKETLPAQKMGTHSNLQWGENVCSKPPALLFCFSHWQAGGFFEKDKNKQTLQNRIWCNWGLSGNTSSWWNVFCLQSHSHSEIVQFPWCWVLHKASFSVLGCFRGLFFNVQTEQYPKLS